MSGSGRPHPGFAARSCGLRDCGQPVLTVGVVKCHARARPRRHSIGRQPYFLHSRTQRLQWAEAGKSPLSVTAEPPGWSDSVARVLSDSLWPAISAGSIPGSLHRTTTVKRYVLFSSRLCQNSGGAKIAFPSAGASHPMASSGSIVAEPGSALDPVGASEVIHSTSLAVAPAPPQGGSVRGRPGSAEEGILSVTGTEPGQPSLGRPVSCR